MCCHMLSLHLRNIREFFPLLLPKEMCSTWRRGIAWMVVPWINHLEGTGKWLLKNTFRLLPLRAPPFLVPHSFPCCAEREWEAAQLGLHNKGRVVCLRGSTPCGAASLRPVVRSLLYPQASGEQRQSWADHGGCKNPETPSEMGLVWGRYVLCWGSASAAFWGPCLCGGARGLTGCFFLCEMSRQGGIKTL